MSRGVRQEEHYTFWRNVACQSIASIIHVWLARFVYPPRTLYAVHSSALNEEPRLTRRVPNRVHGNGDVFAQKYHEMKGI